jgi:hypothetical protein
VFTAFRALQQILQQARSEVIIIDPYVDVQVLDYIAALAENDHGLIVGACVTEAGTRAEREAALRLLDEARGRPQRTLGADKQYQEREFVTALDNVALCRTLPSTNRGTCSNAIACGKKSGIVWGLCKVRGSGSWWNKALPGSNIGPDSGR